MEEDGERRHFIIADQVRPYNPPISEEELIYHGYYNRFYGEEYGAEEKKYFDRWVPIWDAMICELKDSSPPGSWVLTKILIVMNIIVSIMLFDKLLNIREAINTFPNSACIISNQCIGAVFLSMFAHADPIHLLGNMFFLYIVGDNVEIALGRLRYLVLYFTSGLMAAYVQALITFAFNTEYAYSILIGASGAISGLIGAYILLYPGSRMCYCIGFRWIYRCFKIAAELYILIWMIFQFIYLLFAYHIAVWAHIAGFLTGMTLSYILADRRRINRIREYFKKGVYRGLRIPRYELERYSLSGFTRGLIVFVAVLTTVLIVLSSNIVTDHEDEYYNIIGKYRYKGTTEFCRVTQYTPYLPVIECWKKPIYKLEKVYGELSDNPASDQTLDKGRIRIKVFRTIHLDNVSTTSTLLMIISMFTAFAIILICLKGYRGVEITYIPELAKENRYV